jgi:hypothetical protein
MADRDRAQIVHLDTKDWIELARGYYAFAPEFEEIAKIAIERSNSGRTIFPISLVHFLETVKNVNPERRQRLARYVMLVSQGWTIIPADTILNFEIESACRKWSGQPGYDLRSFAIRKGLSHMVGATGTLVNRDPNHAMPEEEKRRILGQLDGPSGLLKLMEIGFPESEIKRMEEESKATADMLEAIRQSRQEIKDNDHLRRVILADYLVNRIGPRLMPFVSELQLPMTFMIDISTSRDRIEQFFQSIPTSYCEAQLTLYQTLMQRTIRPNDMNDIMSLAIAIPYSNVVITEKMWDDGIRQTGLGALYQTIVLRSVRELPRVLT